jgi:PAS domain S-box-containing protein
LSFVGTPYTAALALSTATSAAAAVWAWHRRSVPGGVPFAAMMCAVVVWSLGSTLESAAVEQVLKLQFSKLSYLGTACVAPLFLLFALDFYRSRLILRPAHVVALWVVPAVTVALAATSELHGLFLTDPTPSPDPASNLLLYAHGPAYWVSVAYAFVLVLAATVLIVRGSFRSPKSFRFHTAILLAGTAFPWIGLVLYLTPLNPFAGLDMPVIAFAVTGLLLIWGMSTRKLFALVPVARDLLVEQMGDGLLVLDAEGRIVDCNPAAIRLLGASRTIVGRGAAQALASWPELASLAAEPQEASAELIREGQGRRHCELRAAPLFDARGRLSGRMLLLRDITERRQAEADRERLIGELRQALADVKILRGLLPICASCRKVRDDRGYWKNLEQYIAEHSEAEFSHGLCPECLRRLYPELAEDVLGEPSP